MKQVQLWADIPEGERTYREWGQVHPGNRCAAAVTREELEEVGRKWVRRRITKQCGQYVIEGEFCHAHARALGLIPLKKRTWTPSDAPLPGDIPARVINGLRRAGIPLERVPFLTDEELFCVRDLGFKGLRYLRYHYPYRGTIAGYTKIDVLAALERCG